MSKIKEKRSTTVNVEVDINEELIRQMLGKELRKPVPEDAEIDAITEENGQLLVTVSWTEEGK